MLRKRFKKLIVWTMGFAIVLSSSAWSMSPMSVSAAGSSYYVDSNSGNDSNSGTSANAAWRTLTKVNSINFSPGDKILFKAGGTWTGQLCPRGSGANGSPIVIDMYGSGNKPVIQANGTKHNTLYLKNQSYWEINNLEITNQVSTWGDYRGISINGDDYGVINHIYIKNCYVHDVKGEVNWIGGDPANNSDGVNFKTGWDASKKTGGIVFDVQATASTHRKTTFNDVLIQGCTLKNNSFSSIIFKQIDAGTGYGIRNSASDSNWAPHTNVTIKDNYIDHSGSGHACNGMYITDVRNGIIENNVIKGAGTSGIELYYGDSITIQKNEVFDTVKKSGGADSNGIDPDSSTTNIIVQYNYVHGNGDGILFCQIGFGGNCIVRYNILQNNSRMAFNLHSASGAAADIYNNTVYTSMSSSELVSSSGGTSTLNKGTYRLKNNIFYSSVSGPVVTGGTRTTFDYNCYYGVTAPSDSHKVTSNPLMADPGKGVDGSSAGTAFNSLGGYKLQSSSPCISHGTAVWSGGKDFWGTPLYNGSPDIGANESVSGGGDTPVTLSGIYKIKNNKYGTYIDSDGDGAVILCSSSSYDDQQWEVSINGYGYYFIKNVRSGRYYLDTELDSVVIWNDGSNTTSDAQWAIAAAGDGTYTINNLKPGREFLYGTADNRVLWNTGATGDDTKWVFERVN